MITVINRTDSGKLRQTTTVSSQGDILPYPWLWRSWYFNWKPHFAKAQFYRLPYYVLVDDLKSTYYFILLQGKLWFVIVFILFFSEGIVFCTDPHLYMNLPSILFSIKFSHNILSVLISQMNKSAQKYIETIPFSYHQKAPNIRIDKDSQLIVVVNI